MGILSPQIWNGDPRRDFYSYFYFPDGDATSKWSCRFGESAIKAGASFDYSIAIAVGSLKEVRTALDAYVNSEGLLASKLP
jgi:hypothetical protein